MATFTITNQTSDLVSLGDFYAEVGPLGTITITNRTADELPGLVGLQALVADGTVTLTVTMSQDELDSNMLAPPNSVGGDDIQEVASTGLLSTVALFRKAFTAGLTGTADDVTIYAVGTLPYKFRVLDAWAKVTDAVALETINVYDEAAGGGTLVASLSGAATGRADATDNASVAVTPSATKGLFVRRSDRAVGGEVFLLIRREA